MTKQKKLTFSTLMKQLSPLMLHDKQRFTYRLHNIKKFKKLNVQKIFYQKIAQEIEQATKKILLRESARPKITYPDNLPIILKKQDILKTIHNHQVVIIAGETGSGKTTQLPKICIELGRGIKGMIGHTQPRRLAARTIMHRISEELQTHPNGCISYKVRFSDHISNTTLVKLMTDGILLAEIQKDHLLMQYDTIIIDEAHERSLNIDFLLGYLKKLLPYRPDLKVIITSATIDLESFSKHFNNAPIIEVSGRTYPVEVRYRPIVKCMDDTERNQFQAIFDAIDELSCESFGDILIFMSGEHEIHNTAEVLRKRNLQHTEILPLYARLSNDEQNRVLNPHSLRRIVLATNIAETSLTVPGIKYVIDLGTVRISRYDYRTKIQRLPIELISKASANQRKGRCGRMSDGICIRLYSEDDFQSRPEFTDPEILRTNLASIILQMTALGLGDIATFPFIEIPDKRNIQDGIRLLKELRAITAEEKNRDYKLTPLGYKLNRFPIDLRLARIILEAQNYGCLREAMIIASALSIQDPRERPIDKQQASDEKHRRFHDNESDFISFVNLWNYLEEQQEILSSKQFRRQCQMDFLNYLRVREWQDIYNQLLKVTKDLDISLNNKPAEYREIHIALLSGLLSFIGSKDANKQAYIGVRNTRFSIFPGSGLFKKLPNWVMVAELVETNRLWGRTVARIDPEWIEIAAQHLLKRSYSEPHWERKYGAVMATEKITVYGLLIISARKVNYSQINPMLCRELFIRHALVEGDWQTRHVFFYKNLKLCAEVEEMEHKSRRRNILVDNELLFKFYDHRISRDVISASHFDSWWKETKKEMPDLLNFEKNMLIKDGVDLISKFDYPNFWHQGNLKLNLTYQFEPGSDDDGVTVHIPLNLLNQVEENGFEWQIPGLRQELVIALIKSLPKIIRRNFVPVQNYAEAFLNCVKPLELPLLDALEYELRRMTGITICRESWHWDQVPNHLKINFRVIDNKNKKLQDSRSLSLLKERLKKNVQETLSAIADEGINQSKLCTWNFGSLNKSYERSYGAYKVKAWPALVDEYDSVAIKLFDNQQEQKQVMWCGLRRLLLLNIASPIKYLHEKLPNKTKLGLYINPYDKVIDIVDDCISCGVDRLIYEAGGLVWTETEFIKLQEKVRTEINDIVLDIAKQVYQILVTVFKINNYIKKCIDINMMLGLSDIKEQMNGLLYRGFVTGNGFKRLDDTLRYLQAIEKRLEKLVINPNHDYIQMMKVRIIQQTWQSWLNELPYARRNSNDVQAIRWMIEELRVSLFAQHLGTPYPISDKRILQAMKNITK